MTLEAQLAVVDPGRYIERTEIARGGMGRISSARDCRLGRAVALKELCVDQPESRARLVREAMLTARLAHPSIVSLHEAGQWPDGKPFFAMKLVPGRSLDRVIAERTTLAGRLALLPHILAVADALAYAHQHRVIHRDLKPHNVLVGEFGETVVIDWGLAKDLTAGERDEPSGPHAAADPSWTVDGVVLGTPAYMPPEQAAGDPVDERADVYAIGAMLYHLLAGEPPYGAMAGVAIVAMLPDEPPAPLAELEPGAPADLLAIVDRAMARDPEDRYATARGLADDLHRFHAGQLVGAHHYSWRDLARRWLARNRRAVGVGVFSMLVLLVFGVVTVTRIVRAEHVAQDERVNADRHRADAEELLEFMLGDLQEKLHPLNQLGLLESVARKARDYFENRPDDLGTDDLRKHAVALLDLGDVLIANGHTDGARTEYGRALELARGLVLVSKNSPQMRNVLSRAYIKVGDVLKLRGDLARAAIQYGEALAVAPAELPYLRDFAQAHGRTGDALWRLGDLPRSLAEYRVELAVRYAIATTDPTNSRLQGEIANARLRAGNVLRLQADSPAALAEYAIALEMIERLVAAEPTNALLQRDLASAHERLGATLDVETQQAEALAHQRTSLAIRVRLAETDPSNHGLQRDVSVAHFKIADLLAHGGEIEEALPEYRADLEITERLAASDPGNADMQRDLLVSHNRIGGVLLGQHHPVAAVDAYRSALGLAERIAAKDPANLRAAHDLSVMHRRIGDSLSLAGDRRAALFEYRISLAFTASVVARSPNNTDWQRDLSVAHEFVGKTLLALGQRQDAVQQLRLDLELAHRVAAHDPGNTELEREVVKSQSLLTNALAQR
ncbi:hypothetical protein BH11MYX3_BH11MYX3_21230 [soil metagenome]